MRSPKCFRNSAPCKTRSEIKYCRVCVNALPALARKCTKCDAWQSGWRAWLPVTDASLSVFLATVSVLTVIVPPALRWIGRESLTRVAIVTAEPNGELLVAVSNVGRRPTVLRSYSVEFVGAPFLPRQMLTPRNSQNALLLPDQNATITLFGAARIPLPETARADYDQWIQSGTVKLTACVKESGAGVARANALAAEGTCESRGLVSRTDSIAAIHLSEWIKGRVQWPTRENIDE